MRDHPYAHPPGGEQASVAAISVDDMRAFPRPLLRRGECGRVDRRGGQIGAQAETIAERVTGALPRGEHAPPLPPPPVVSGAELRESFPSSQTHIYVGQAGMARHDPDYFALYVGNHVLGGGALVSTLGEEVRNKRGLSYSVYSYFSPMRVDGPFLMVAQTKNEQADEALEVMRDDLGAISSRTGPSQEELDAAKQNLIGGFPLRIASNGKIVEYLSMMGFYDYPLDWLDP